MFLYIEEAQKRHCKTSQISHLPGYLTPVFHLIISDPDALLYFESLKGHYIVLGILDLSPFIPVSSKAWCSMQRIDSLFLSPVLHKLAKAHRLFLPESAHLSECSFHIVLHRKHYKHYVQAALNPESLSYWQTFLCITPPVSTHSYMCWLARRRREEPLSRRKLCETSCILLSRKL